jgi:Cdc6-like AAA superfamily ATPase
MNSLNGINGTIFLYGQTGSGKTHTMLGVSNDGILIQSLKDLFDEVQNDLDKSFVVRCSYIEIYNEQIFDLLKPHNKLSEVLTVAEDFTKEFYVRGVIEESVQNIGEILEVLSRGEKNRHYAQTSMNHHSSRSHTIFRLTLQSVTNNFIRNYRRE